MGGGLLRRGSRRPPTAPTAFGLDVVGVGTTSLHLGLARTPALLLTASWDTPEIVLTRYSSPESGGFLRSSFLPLTMPYPRINSGPCMADLGTIINQAQSMDLA